MTEASLPAASPTGGVSRFDRTAAAILDAAAHVLSERGNSANMADVAAAAGVSRATLYRYYPHREALLKALAAQAVADAGSRLADAGLGRASVEEALERILRALLPIGDRYGVLVREQIEADSAEIERLIGGPIRAVFARGIESGVFRRDVPVEVLLEVFGGAIRAAFKLIDERRLGIEEASAAVVALFLDGARMP